MIVGAVAALMFAGLLIAAIGAAISWLRSDSKPAAVRPAAPAPSQRASPPIALVAPRAGGPPPAAQRAAHGVVAPDEGRRRRAKPRDVVQDAVDEIADMYRDRLQIILEQRDGPGWLGELNQRRHVSMIRDGKPAPRAYAFLEPRAVLNCLAYDDAGLQLISAAAVKKARQLSGLVNDAHHPDPGAPLTEADGYRAWQLYTDITGHARTGDPFDR